jgi:hypothetical protein
LSRSGERAVRCTDAGASISLSSSECNDQARWRIGVLLVFLAQLSKGRLELHCSFAFRERVRERQVSSKRATKSDEAIGVGSVLPILVNEFKPTDELVQPVDMLGRSDEMDIDRRPTRYLQFKSHLDVRENELDVRACTCLMSLDSLSVARR